MGLFQQAIVDTPLALGLDKEMLAAWPQRSPRPSAQDRLRVLLMLQLPWRGGNWEHTRYLVEALDLVARRHGRVHLELAVHAQQTGLSALPGHLRVHRCRLHRISRSTAAAWGPEIAARLAARPEEDFCFLSGAGEAALAADAWLLLSDRFPLPLLPARPYAVVVHDMLHLHVPEAFHRAYFRNLAQGAGPTLRHADRVIVTSPGTWTDVVRGYALDPKQVALVPVACQPHRRFAHLPCGFVPLPRQDFLLNVSNGSPHKGADLLLRAYALLKARLKENTPLLVVCGVNTEYLSPSCDAGGPPYWHHCRRLFQELGLAEGRDVLFLGAVTDIELKDLYQRCQAVVHAARHDNGSYCLIEAVWFGKPVVSTRYAAVEFLVERFGLEDTLLVPLGDAAALAEGMLQARNRGPVEEARLARFRDHLLHPRFSFEEYAEQVHQLLVELASQGRSERQAASPARRRGDRTAPDSEPLSRVVPQASR
jgi:glycosyltransferase involved in cell wall biosynthesis